MTLRLCQKSDSVWGYGSTASQIHNLAHYYKNHTPSGDRFAFTKEIDKISTHARGIIHVVTHVKHPVDLHGDIISNIAIEQELTTLIDDLKGIVNHVESALQRMLPSYWETSFETIVRTKCLKEMFTFQDYTVFSQEMRKKCRIIENQALDMQKILPMLQARIDRGNDYAEESSIQTSMEEMSIDRAPSHAIQVTTRSSFSDRFLSQPTELRPLLLKKE